MLSSASLFNFRTSGVRALWHIASHTFNMCEHGLSTQIVKSPTTKTTIIIIIIIIRWLVDLTMLKNIREWEGLSYMKWKFLKPCSKPSKFHLALMSDSRYLGGLSSPGRPRRYHVAAINMFQLPEAIPIAVYHRFVIFHKYPQ